MLDTDDLPLCPYCQGCGEGKYEGTTCTHCRGTGEERDWTLIDEDKACYEEWCWECERDYRRTEGE